MLDANTLISSQGVYYPQAMVPELWSWLLYQGQIGRVKMPYEIYEEVLAGKDDPLTQWLKKDDVKGALLLSEEVDPATLIEVTHNGYAPDLNEDEIAFIGRDPFLIAYGKAGRAERCVVTLEASKPSTKRQNRRVPDVCKDMGVECCNVFSMMRQLEFHTGWEKQKGA
ncbi:DUF4411 family protein [Pseudomonas aeruginosa]|uniref:DUF4411 family protein n=2 Tax=Pseudomonas aeruginosa TaxID=287 RepID=UPI00197B9B8F|nr:DUF4411 family protein [Pseudomonas aeruginosa]